MSVASRIPSKRLSSSGNSLKNNSNNNNNNNTNTNKNTNNNNIKWKSPFISFISNGPRQRKHINSNSDFAFYDLSSDESIYDGNSKFPMKKVPDKQKQILLDGKRESYLECRWDITPDTKYYFPEATSMRYGWVHNVRCKSKKDN